MQINPIDPTALYNKGLALEQLGKFEEAQKYFEKVRVLDRNNQQMTILLLQKFAVHGHAINSKKIESV